MSRPFYFYCKNSMSSYSAFGVGWRGIPRQAIIIRIMEPPNIVKVIAAFVAIDDYAYRKKLGRLSGVLGFRGVCATYFRKTPR
jgi:hypothetical protein